MQSNSFKAGKFNFTIFYTRGTVVGKDKNFETIVSGIGGGGMTFQGTGGAAPFSMSSRTVIHDKIYLKKQDGTEEAFELKNWDIACREGHEMMFVWVIKDNNTEGPYVALKNFTTNTIQFNNKIIKDISDQHLKFNFSGCLVVLLLLVSILVTFGLSLIPILMWEFYVRGVSKDAEQAVKNNIKQFLDSHN